MANLAELDLAFSQPCSRCARLLHGRVKFCPYCGGGNDVPMWGDEAANGAFEPGRVKVDDAEPAEAEAPSEALSVVPPIVLDARHEAGTDAGLDIAHIVPAAFEWPDDLPATITTVQPRTPAARRGPILQYTAIGLAIVASVLALVLAYVRFDRDNEAERARALAAQLAQAQSAVKAARSPDFGEAASAPAPAAQAPVVLAPVTAIAAPEPEKTACNEALAALALCPADALASTGSGR